jgi:hypothetical protein
MIGQAQSHGASSYASTVQVGIQPFLRIFIRLSHPAADKFDGDVRPEHTILQTSRGQPLISPTEHKRREALQFIGGFLHGCHYHTEPIGQRKDDRNEQMVYYQVVPSSP